MPARVINQRGEALIKHFESLYLSAYEDLTGVLTIGWGHTGLTHQDGTVFPGREITEAEAEKLFRHDMDNVERRVTNALQVKINDDQFSALVSFEFNVGGLHDSTLLRMLNAGDHLGAANQFLRWNKATDKRDGKKKVVDGLTRRRLSEARLFCGFPNPIVETVAQMKLWHY